MRQKEKERGTSVFPLSKYMIDNNRVAIGKKSEGQYSFDICVKEMVITILL